MNTLYKVVTEVKVFHEYYLTEETGKTIFEYGSQPERTESLLRSFATDRPTIGNDISFEIFPDTQEAFGNHKLKLIPSYSGFKILSEVTETSLGDGSLVFKPAYPLPPAILIGFKRKNAAMDAYTNSPVNPAVPSIYCFSNKARPGTRDYPVLSARLPIHNVLTSYEQGDLSQSSSGTTQQFFLDENGNEQFLDVLGGGFANENDRILISPRFNYTFPPNANVTSATFRLLDNSDQEIHTITTGEGSRVRKVTLDFRGSLTFSGPKKMLSEKYTLEVRGNNIAREHEIIFIGTDIDLRSYWGVVHLVPEPEDDQFRLLDEDGYLRLRRNPDGNLTIPDYFEVRVKSRPTFWRYANEQGKKIKMNTTLDDFLKYDPARGVMTSLSMRNAARTPTDFTGNGNSRFLPHPLSFDPLRIEDGRIITDIRVPRSDLFDV